MPPPRYRPAASATPHCSIQLWESGRYATEISCEWRHRWLGTFETLDLTAGVASAEEARFPAPEMCIVSRREEKTHRRVEAQRSAEEWDRVYMQKIAKANPHLVEAEL